MFDLRPQELMEDFLLPASKALVEKRAGRLADIAQGHVMSICQTTETINAAYDLLVALCTGCVENLKLVSKILTEMFYQGLFYLYATLIVNVHTDFINCAYIVSDLKQYHCFKFIST